ncbi:MAG: ATP-binding protein [Solirubrobacteraceae bacterium]
MSGVTENPWVKAGSKSRQAPREETAAAPDRESEAVNPWVGLSGSCDAPDEELLGVPEPDEETVPSGERRSRRRRLLTRLRRLDPRRARAAERETEEEAEQLPDPEIAFRSRAVGGAGFIPADTRRRDRRSRNRQAQHRGRAHRKVKMRERKAAMDAENQARKDAAYLPAMGEKGPEAGRPLFKLKVPAHHATSEVLAVAYPFLAEAGLGSDGTLMGHDSWSGAAFCFDLWNLYQRLVVTNTNLLLAGVIGRGKSCLAKSLATRSIAFGRKVYVPGDPKGEWSPVSRAVGGGTIALGPGMPTRINPLDEGPRPDWWIDPDGHRERMTDEMWVNVVTSRRRDLLLALTQQALGRDLESVEVTALFAALEVSVREHATPVLPHVVHAMMEPPGAVLGSSVQQLLDDGRAAAHALNRVVSGDLAGLFDGESTTAFDASLPMLNLDMSRMQGNETLIALAMTCASAWMEAALADPDGGQRWVIYDEAWRLMRQPALLARMQTQWKLSRHWGIANMMVIHRLSDLDAVGEANSSARNLALGLLADCSTRIIYAQEDGEARKTGERIGLSETEIAQLPDLVRGEGLWRIGGRAFVVSHDLTPGEREVYNTDQRMHA